MKEVVLFIFLIITSNFLMAINKRYELSSPDSKIKMTIHIHSKIEYSIIHAGESIVEKSPISISLNNGTIWGNNPYVSGVKKTQVNKTIDALMYKKNKVIDNYNQLSLTFREGFAINFRAYNDGIAYRFQNTSNTNFEVRNEEFNVNMPINTKLIVSYVNNNNGKKKTFEEQFKNSFENTYTFTTLSNWEKGRLAFLPLVYETKSSKKVCIIESDLINYPGMYLYPGSDNSLKGVFAPCRNITRIGGHNMLQELVETRFPYIAKFEEEMNFPWRGIIIAEKDYELVNSDFVYKLASESKLSDVSWIKPGKAAWEWWNDWNIYGVDFISGINTQTYKYYIDFASLYGLEYIIIDEGWTEKYSSNLFTIVPEIDLKELIDYANSKNVGIILWAGYNTIVNDMENVFKEYSSKGIKGFKIDFMDHDDQFMVNFHYKVAETAAKYKLLIDFHGTYKPTGLNRTFPNVLNFEGVHGLEQLKFVDSTVNQVEYDVTIPFIRMVAGPMDYTPGAMRNGVRKNFRAINSEPMSQGTRCRQLAAYVVFEAPLSVLCDSPTNYFKEHECTQLISSIPTVWDETIALNGRIAEFVCIARRKGNDWYVGGMTNWKQREFEIDLGFLANSNYHARLFTDGKNANKSAQDYKVECLEVSNKQKIGIKMAPGGGFILKLTKK